MDLMTYEPRRMDNRVFSCSGKVPRQSILTVFNWTDRPRSHSLSLTDSRGLPVELSTMVATAVMDSSSTLALEASGAIRLENQSTTIGRWP